jgi:hypothetical protein
MHFPLVSAALVTVATARWIAVQLDINCAIIEAADTIVGSGQDNHVSNPLLNRLSAAKQKPAALFFSFLLCLLDNTVNANATAPARTYYFGFFTYLGWGAP